MVRQYRHTKPKSDNVALHKHTYAGYRDRDFRINCNVEERRECDPAWLSMKK
jgi:hypothetical protein